MKVQPFTFDSFVDETPKKALDDAAQSSVIDETAERIIEPKIPTFSTEELEQAKVIAKDAGFMAGKKEGLREAEHQQRQHQTELDQVMQAISQQLNEISNQSAMQMQQHQAMLGQLVIHCAKQVAGRSLQDHAVNEVKTMIEECVMALFETPEISVKAHPEIASQLPEMLAGTPLVVIADDTLQIADCQIHWLNGYAKRDTTQIWAEMEAIINRYFVPETENINPTHPPLNQGEVT